MQKDAIAVIMSAYNEKEAWFRSAVESVLNQTYDKIHLYILLDNPNNHVLWKAMQEYAAQDKRVSIYRNCKNLGLVASLNKLLGMITENIVARMDADDICYEYRLEKELQFMNQYQLDFVVSSIDFIRNDILERGPDIPCLLPELFAECEKYGNYATHPTWLLKRYVYEQLNGYRKINYCEDFDFVLRAIQSGFRIGRTQEVLLHYRMRTSGISSSYAYEQYEKSVYLRAVYGDGSLVSEVVSEELNRREDFSDEALKIRFQMAKAQIDAFASDLYQRKYVSAGARAFKGILTSGLYRKIFFEILKSNRNVAKVFRKAKIK